MIKESDCSIKKTVAQTSFVCTTVLFVPSRLVAPVRSTLNNALLTSEAYSNDKVARSEAMEALAGVDLREQ